MAAEMSEERLESIHQDGIQYGVVRWEDTVDLLNEVRRLRARTDALDGLMSESRGVVGWHLNGDIALWDEFPELSE